MLLHTQKKPEESGMNIIIVGCGKVGFTLAERLSLENHDVTIIDSNPEAVSKISTQLDVMGIVGNGASYQTQIDAGIKDADLIIAVTESDELNLLCCTIATQVVGCAAIARVRTPDYSHEVGYLREKLGLAMIINPEMEAARQISRILSLPTALEVNSFSHGLAELIKLRIPDSNMLCDMTISHLGRHITNNILICAVEREDELYIPDGNFRLQAGDTISFLSTRKTALFFLKKIGFPTNQVHSALIVGGGKASYYLALRLLAAGISVKIIEINYKRCQELSTLLPDAIIVCGDGTNEDFLREQGITQAEAFIPLTNIDEENIMLTLYARHVSHAKLITKINRITFTNVINELDLGSVIYPRYLTSESIIAYVRARKASIGSNVESLYHICDQRVEAIEFRVREESPVANKYLKDLPLRKNLLVGCIIRDGVTIIPSGTDMIQIGDAVIIVTTHSGLKNIRDILE